MNDYINRLRIEKSVYLLTNTNLNINEISYEVGFTYPRYFSTSFKQIKGMTPTQFKEEKKKNNAGSVDFWWGYAYSLAMRNRKNFLSATPLRFALNNLILDRKSVV